MADLGETVALEASAPVAASEAEAEALALVVEVSVETARVAVSALGPWEADCQVETYLAHFCREWRVALVRSRESTVRSEASAKVVRLECSGASPAWRHSLPMVVFSEVSWDTAA